MFASTAWGQQSAPTAQGAVAPQRLTLAVALDLANRQNLDLAAARLQRSVALAGVRIAGQLPNPTANFTALRDEPHEGLFFDQPLLLGGKRHRGIELAQQQAQLTDVEIATVARQVRRKTREAYFQAALARGLTEQRARALELAKRVRDIAQARFEAGDVPQLEVFQADLEVSRAQTDLEVAQQEEKVAFSRLNALLNEPADMAWDLGESLESLPADVTLPELIQRASASNPDLQHLAQETKVEQSRKSLLRAQRFPDVTLELGVDFNSPRDFRYGPRGQIAVGLPLFTRNQGEIAQSQANERVLDAETSATRRAVAGRVEAAYYELRARETEVMLYRQTLLPAGRRLESMAEESYRAGKSNLLTVLDAQRNVQQLERDYLLSLSALQTAFAELEETAGVSLD